MATASRTTALARSSPVRALLLATAWYRRGEAKDKFRSPDHLRRWMPGTTRQAGVVKKWADKYGIEIESCRSTTTSSRSTSTPPQLRRLRDDQHGRPDDSAAGASILPR